MAPSTHPLTVLDLQSDPLIDTPMSYIPVADALRKRGRLALALDVCQKGISTGRGSAAGHILLARIHLDMGKYELAEKACDAALAHAPNSISARKIQIQMALKRRLYIRALELLEQFKGEMGDDPDLVAAFLEAQRGMAERFARELMAGTNGLGVSLPTRPWTREELMGQLRARPEVLEIVEVATDDTQSEWAQMLRLWESHCTGSGNETVQFSVLETSKQSFVISDLGEGKGTLVVTLARNAAFGPVKRIADLLAAKKTPTAEGTPA